MIEKYISIRITEQLEKKMINFSPRSQPKLASQYRCPGSREVTLPWHLVHRRLASYFQNFHFNQLQKTMRFISVNFSCNRLKHDFIVYSTFPHTFVSPLIILWVDTWNDDKFQFSVTFLSRHWQELGYLILYVTARPDLQHNKVVGWLAQHNFPHGMVVFMDGFSKEPIRQKIQYLKHLQHEVRES